MSRLKWNRWASAVALFCCGFLQAANEPMSATGDARLTDALSFPEGVERLPALKAEIGRRLDRLQTKPYPKEELLPLAYLYHGNGYDERAKTLYDWMIDRSDGAEERARLRYLAADAVKEEGDSAMAMAYLEAATREYKGYPLAFARLGEAKLKSNDRSGAEAQFRAALALEGDLPSARIGLARIYEGRGDLEEAITALEGVLRSDPDNYNAQALLVRVFAQLGDAKRALSLGRLFSRSSMPPVDDPWLEPVRSSIFDPQRLDFLFFDYFAVGDYESALHYLDKMERIDPGNARYCRYRGTILSKQERHSDASAIFRKGIELGGDDKELYPLLVRSLGFEGLAAEAEAAARKGLAESEPTAELLLELARLLVDREELGDAMRALTDAVAIDPYDLEVHLLRGRIGMWIHEKEQARASLDMVQQLAPRDTEILVRAGLVFMEAGKFAEALPYLEMARQATPGHADAIELLADAHSQLAKAALERSELEQALAHLDKALLVRPQLLEALSAKAQLLIRLKRFEDAERAFGELLGEMRDDPTLLLVYGDLLYKNGKTDEARASWRRSLGLLGDDDPRSQLRQRLARRLSE